ncbi:MAG: FtsX-like permease family protein, partial [Bacteroidota bacterium]
MNIFKLTISYIQQRKLGTFLNALLLGLGVATIVVLMLFSKQLDENLQSNVKGIDLVVGAKGSPIQLILSSVFHLDAPTGNIPVEEARLLSEHPMVKETIPLALGDSYKQYRIVGSTPALLDHYEASFSEGGVWATTFEAVVGAQLAEEAGIGIGDELISAHGIGGGSAHDEHPLDVVGVLEATGTVLDRLVVTDVTSVWAVHGMHAANDGHDDHEDGHDDHEDGHDDHEDGHDDHEDGHDDHEDGHDDHEDGHDDHEDGHDDHEDEVVAEKDLEYTSLLVKYTTPIAAATLPRYINNETNLQAAAPVFQTARLLSLLGTGIDAFRAFAFVLIVVASLGVFIALYNAMKERAFDLAIMRTMGASRGLLFVQVLIEGILLALLGAICGLILGHVAAHILGLFIDSSQGIGLNGLTFSMQELWLVVLAVGIGAVASLLPAILAYRT